jgi:hypothetical protein
MDLSQYCEYSPFSYAYRFIAEPPSSRVKEIEPRQEKGKPRGLPFT